jgi:cell division protein ZapA (FtsZ GTPase activity inhibitor)
MAQNVHKVVIGGIEYRLTSDDEKSLRKAVDLVNYELDVLNKQSDVKLPITQLYVLVSLNLAEKLAILGQKINSDQEYVKYELNKMSEFIDNSLI